MSLKEVTFPHIMLPVSPKSPEPGCSHSALKRLSAARVMLSHSTSASNIAKSQKIKTTHFSKPNSPKARSGLSKFPTEINSRGVNWCLLVQELDELRREMDIRKFNQETRDQELKRILQSDAEKTLPTEEVQQGKDILTDEPVQSINCALCLIL